MVKTDNELLTAFQPRIRAEHFEKMRAKAKKLASLGMSQYEINAHLWNITGDQNDDRKLFEIAQSAAIDHKNGDENILVEF